MTHHRPYSTPSAVAPAPVIPAAIDPAAVQVRQSAMIDAGTHPMIAEKLAVEAAANQVLRDRHPKFAPADPQPEITPAD